MVRPEQLAPQPQPVAPVSSQQSYALRPEDLALIEEIKRGPSGEKFIQLMNGDTSVCGNDHSVADLSFCNILAARTQDPAQIDRIVRNSGLMRPKWERPNGNGTYGSMTILKAISSALAYRQQLEQQRNASLAASLPPAAVSAQQAIPQYPTAVSAQQAIPQQPMAVPVQQMVPLPPTAVSAQQAIPQQPTAVPAQQAIPQQLAAVPVQQMVPQQPMATASPLPALLANKGIAPLLPTPAAAQQMLSKMQWQIPISAEELQKMSFPKPEFLIDGLLTVGLALLVAPPKTGKSQFCDDIALSIATGAPILGRNTTQAGVLYAALEDQYGRIQDRMNRHLDNCTAPPNVYYLTDLPQTDTGLYTRLDAHLAMHPDTKLVIIDIMQMVRSKNAMQGNNYQADSRELSTLKQYADLRNICVLLVHHNRKMLDDNDVYNQISGTTGLMGAADTVLLITTKKRSKENAVLHVTGRDIPDQSLVIRFDRTSLCWELVGTADEVSANDTLKEYMNNPTVNTIRELVNQSANGEWRGTATDLINIGKSKGRVLAGTPQKMGRELSRLEKQLEINDGIHHEVVKLNGNGAKLQVFTSLVALQVNAATKNDRTIEPIQAPTESPDDSEYYEDGPDEG